MNVEQALTLLVASAVGGLLVFAVRAIAHTCRRVLTRLAVHHQLHHFQQVPDRW
jgi:hypothetical protein